jgi:hypothetical protein
MTLTFSDRELELLRAALRDRIEADLPPQLGAEYERLYTRITTGMLRQLSGLSNVEQERDMIGFTEADYRRLQDSLNARRGKE